MWFNSVEFYVIAGALAAGAVIAASLPSRRGAAALHLVAGTLEPLSADKGESPRLEVEVDDNCCVRIVRRGLRGVSMDGAVSLAINVVGFDVSIEERVTKGPGGTDEAGSVEFRLDFFGRERYHVKYNSEDTGLFCAFTLNVEEGIRIRRELK